MQYHDPETGRGGMTRPEALRTAVPAIEVYIREAIAELRKSWRLPQFLLPTVLTPAGFFALFGVIMGNGSAARANYALATFGIFAAIGPSLFGACVGVALEREGQLIALKRVSPLPGGAYLAAKVIAALVFTALTLAIIYPIGLIAGAQMAAKQWFNLATLHLASAVPFALIGFGIGMRMKSKGAIAMANALLLGFAVLGGLWIPVAALPGWLQAIAWATPSFHLGEIGLALAGVARPQPFALHCGFAAVMVAAAALFAWSGWQRSDT